MTHFDAISIQPIPRTQNAYADSLARLTYVTTAGKDNPITIEVIIKPHPTVEVLEIRSED